MHSLKQFLVSLIISFIDAINVSFIILLCDAIIVSLIYLFIVVCNICFIISFIDAIIIFSSVIEAIIVLFIDGRHWCYQGRWQPRTGSWLTYV